MLTQLKGGRGQSKISAPGLRSADTSYVKRGRKGHAKVVTPSLRSADTLYMMNGRGRAKVVAGLRTADASFIPAKKG